MIKNKTKNNLPVNTLQEDIAKYEETTNLLRLLGGFIKRLESFSQAGERSETENKILLMQQLVWLAELGKNPAMKERLAPFRQEMQKGMEMEIQGRTLFRKGASTRGWEEALQDHSPKQLLDLLNNILELARIENHKIIIEEELVDVRETFHKLCTIFSSDLKKKNLSCTVDVDISHPYLYMDTVHYSQVFLNIVSNAVKYTPDGGAVSLSFKELPGDTEDTCLVETVIEDNGIGMSEEFQAYAYESFSRERTSTVSGIQGTGLGLAIVKDLVSLMNGRVTLKSRQGMGTKVTVCLPHRFKKAPADKKEGEPDSWENLRFDGVHILLAEDIDVNAIIATKLLSSKGCIVERARDGVECVNMLLKANEGYYDLVLMDIQMPIMDGYQAARSIRSFDNVKKASVPILAMTANAFREDCEKAAEAGMDGHIAKPLNAGDMFRKIGEVLKINY